MRSPGRRSIVDSPTTAAWGETVTTSESFACSSVTSTVMSFVMLAIGTRFCASCETSTSPVAPFSTSHDVAWTGGGAAAAVATRTAATTATLQTAIGFTSTPRGREIYLTRICWPTCRLVGSMPGLSATSRSTVVP